MSTNFETEIVFGYKNATIEETLAYFDVEFARQEVEIAREKAEYVRRDAELARQDREMAIEKAELAKRDAELTRNDDELDNSKKTDSQALKEQRSPVNVVTPFRSVVTAQEKFKQVEAKEDGDRNKHTTSQNEIKNLYLEPYGFPREAFDESGFAVDFESMTTAELAEALSNLSCERSNGRLRPYGEIRTQICALSIALDHRGELAPRFRDLRRPPPKPQNIDEINLSRDRQFIDIHWLYSTEQRRHSGRGQHKFHQNIYFRKNFTIDFAEGFAQTPESMHDKATWLGLPDHIAFQLAAIQTNAIREKYRVATDGDNRGGLSLDTVIHCLENSVANQPHMADHVQTWSMIWLSAKLVGEKAEVLRTFHAYAEGRAKPLDRRDIVRRLENVNLRLARELTSLHAAA